MSLSTEKVKHYCIPIYNRASYSRIKSLVAKMQREESLRVTVILSGALILKEFDQPRDYILAENPNVTFVEIPIEYPAEMTNESMVNVSSKILESLGTHFGRNSYDAVIVMADRFEMLPVAIAAAYHGLPLVHFQGGEITGNIDEKVRHAISKLSDLHLVSTRMAKEYLIAMGEEPRSVLRVGCPSLDLLRQEQIKRVSKRNAKEKYLISMFHPVTTDGAKAYEDMKSVLTAIITFCVKNRHKCYVFYR